MDLKNNELGWGKPNENNGSYDDGTIKANIKEINSQLEHIENNTKHIINVTNENYEECVAKMKDGYVFNIIEDITLNKNILFSDLNNIEFRCNSVIRVSDDFESNNKSIIKFNKCNDVLFECKELDLENKVLFDSNEMNFIVLFTDCENVNVINTKISNGINIEGLSSSINATNSTKIGKNLRINNLLVNNCKSAVFTQYKGNVIENVKAFNTNDAIIALNSENCINSYINNCYGEYNDAFPLVAVENNAININIDNCIAKNTRGLFELFGLDDDFINQYQPSMSTLNISNCKHIIDDEIFEYDSTVTLTTLSLRRGIEKYVNINIDKVDCFNTTTKKSNYLYLEDTELNDSIIKNLNITNSNIYINSINSYAMLLNASIENLTLKNNNFTHNSNSEICIRHTRNTILINSMNIEGGTIEGFERAFSSDFEYNDFITIFIMKNTRFYNTNAITYNYPNGTITNDDYHIEMFKNDYTLSNRGCSRFTYARSEQPPTVGKWFAGDIAINKNNNEEYYYTGSKWLRRNIVGNIYTESTDNPSTAPTQVNSIYVNINTKKVYISIGTNSIDDWILLN